MHGVPRAPLNYFMQHPKRGETVGAGFDECGLRRFAFRFRKRRLTPSHLYLYAAAKLAAEAYCRAFVTSFSMETVILRYFNVFGPRQDPQSEYSAVIPRFVSMILSGNPTDYLWRW